MFKPQLRYQLFLCLLFASIIGLYFSQSLPIRESSAVRGSYSRTGGPLVIGTVSRHPGFVATELKQREKLLVQVGDTESQVNFALGKPVKKSGSLLIYEVEAVAYDWDSNYSHSRKFLALKIDSERKTQGFIALTPEYARELLESP